MKRGFTLIETIIYVTLLALLPIGAVQILLNSSRSMQEARLERKIFFAGEAAMETLIRDIRQASDVITASSAFNTNPGVLVIRTPSVPGGTTIINRTFSTASFRLQKNDGGANEFLTPPDVRITDLTFWNENATTSSLVTIKMTIEAGDGDRLQAHTFYGSALLRAKY